MGTQHAHRVVNTIHVLLQRISATRIHATIQRKNSIENSANKISGLHKHYERILQNGHLRCS